MSDLKEAAASRCEHREDALPRKNLIATQGVNKRLALINLWNLCGPLSTGFTAAVISACLIRPEFLAYFSLNTRPNAELIIGAIVSCFGIGAAIGLVITGMVSDKWGRKKAYLFNCLFYILGVGLTTGSRNVTMFCFGRLLTGFGGWANMLTGITYGSEISTPKRRGVFGGGYGVAITIGYVLAGWTTVGMYFSRSAFAWRAPLLIQLLFPLLIVAGLPFVPESPRWLAFVSREDEALEILKHIHSSTHDPEYNAAREEHFQICQQAAIDRNLPSSWITMFTTYWRRSAATIMVTAGNQSTGIQFCTNYNSVLFASLGYTGAGPLYLQAGWLMTAMASDIFWAAWLDKIGRRPLILCQPLACACNMAIIVGLYATYAGTTNIAGLRALCAMVYLFVFVYSMDEPAEYVFIAEIFPTHVRTKGIALGTASIMLTSVWLTMSAPIGMATIGWKYFLILCLLGVVYFFAQWKFIKETKGVPLEEIDAIFGDGENVAVYSKDIILDNKGIHSTGEPWRTRTDIKEGSLSASATKVEV